MSAVRNAMYDRGLLASHPLALPAVSVGNLTVGGTGKTPVAAWLAGEIHLSPEALVDQLATALDQLNEPRLFGD